MAIGPGYKQSEAGVIPEDWELVSAADIGRFRGGNGFPLRYQGRSAGDYPFFKVSDMNNEGNETFMVQSRHWIAEAVRKTLGATVFQRNAIVFAKVGAAVFLERKKILAQPSCLDNNMAAFVLDDNRADARFVHVLLLCKRLGELVTTTALPSLNGKQLGQMALPLPSLPEQHAIAASLSDVDALLGGLDRLIAKKCDLKQAAMQQLLTGQTRLPGFSGEWEVKQLGDFADFCAGSYLAQSQYRDGQFEVQGAGRVMGHHDVPNFPRAVSVVGRVGTIGQPRFFPSGCWVNNNAGAIVTQETCATPEFVQLLLLTLDWSKAVSVTAQPFLVIPDLMCMKFSVPERAEQTAIAAVLYDMDAEIAMLEARRAKTRDLKQAMMQELLTGRTRLVPAAA